MCFIADREMTRSLSNQARTLNTFKLARVVNGQLRAPWRDTILGIDPFGSLGSATVALTVPASGGAFESGDYVFVTAWHWRSKDTLPSRVTAANGFYLTTSEEAIREYVQDCGLPRTGLVLLPVSLDSYSVEAVSEDGTFILTDPCIGITSMLNFVSELATMGDDEFIKKYDPGFETTE